MFFLLGLFIAFVIGPYIFMGAALWGAIIVSVFFDIWKGETHEGDVGSEANSMTTYPYPPPDSTTPGDHLSTTDTATTEDNTNVK